MAPKPRDDALQVTDADALALTRRLVRGARFAALATLEPDSGHPLASRVAVATDVDGASTLLVSSLSGHTAALDADGRCSLLFGEPGRGDPLAHPRISVLGCAFRLPRDDLAHERIRRRYLARHPKAELYVDFGDFAFFKLVPERASLNAGFGRAYALDAVDLLASAVDLDALANAEPGAIAHMNADHADAVALYATALAGAPTGAWRIASLDSQGLDLVDGDAIVRVDFPEALQAAADLRPVLVAMAQQARDTQP